MATASASPATSRSRASSFCARPTSTWTASARRPAGACASPQPEFFARVVAEAGAEPGEIAYVGDRVDFDVVPARAAGMVAVHIRRGPWGYLQPGREQADVCIDSLAELPEALEHV